MSKAELTITVNGTTQTFKVNSHLGGLIGDYRSGYIPYSVNGTSHALDIHVVHKGLWDNYAYFQINYRDFKKNNKKPLIGELDVGSQKLEWKNLQPGNIHVIFSHSP